MIYPETQVDPTLTSYHAKQVIECLQANGITFKCYNGRTIEVFDRNTAALVLSPFYTLKVHTACSYTVHLSKNLTFAFEIERSSIDGERLVEYHNFKNFPDGTWVYCRGGSIGLEISMEISSEQAEAQIARFRACTFCREI